MALTTLQTRALQVRRNYPLGQFGQDGDAWTINGKYACGHTLCQMIALIAGRGYWSLDAIAKRAGYPDMRLRAARYRRGMSTSEAVRFLQSLGLNYEVRTGLSYASLVAFSRLGPVLIVHQYRWWPEWKGYEYAGRTADGYPNGYAGPLGAAGATQIGYDTPHWGALIAQDTVATTGAGVVYAMEPNHGSPSRPEHVAFDKMTPAQMQRVYASRNRVAMVPVQVIWTP